MSKIKIGWSEISITPEKGKKIGLAGQFFERITDEVERPITATATAIDNGNDYMIFVSCDLNSIGVNLCENVKALVKNEIDIDVDKIIINAIHTHTSWVYESTGVLKDGSGASLEVFQKYIPKTMIYEPVVSNEESVKPKDALDFLSSRIAKAVIEAWKNREFAFYQNAFGRAVVGHNRRVCFDDGSSEMWGDTSLANFTELEGGSDSGIELIYTFNGDKKPTGVIVNLACPAQAVQHRNFISPDFWGRVKENLRLKFGADFKVLALCSAAGDQCPIDMIRWVNPESPINDPNIKRENCPERRADPSMFDISGMKVVGRRISNEIIGVYEELDGDFKDDGLIKHETVTLALPLRRVTKSEYNDALEKIERFVEKNKGRKLSFEDNAKMHVYGGIVQRYQVQQKINNFNVEVHYIRFGDVAFCTNPFELFLDYGNQIRARSMAKQTFIIQLACGKAGYLPTLKAEKGSHYSAYVSSGVAGHDGGAIIVKDALTHINNMFND